jgi:hypothetical protein
MDETAVTIFKTIIGFIEVAFAEVSIIFFILGLVFFLLGVALFAGSIYTKIAGKKFSGKVIGAINDVRFKEKNRDGVIKKEKKETLHAIFEFADADGVTHLHKSSNGGNSVLKYKTGQDVELLVCRHKNFSDVYDAKDNSMFIMGMIFLLVGFGIMFQSASFYASLGVSTLALVAIIATLVVKLMGGRDVKSKTTGGSSNDPYKFDPADIRPIEEFAEAEKLKGSVTNEN